MADSTPNPDLKSQALTTEHDFYALLSLPLTAPASAIRRAYRQTALKYHPDKLGASDAAALEKFHLLQIAYDVLSDPAVREMYDSARRAREARREREELVKGRRREMVEELERREGLAGGKRKREDGDEAEVVFERELRRLAEDGRRRRMEREEELRREMEDVRKEEEEGEGGAADTSPAADSESKVNNNNNEVQEIDRSISLRYLLSTDIDIDIDKAELISRFYRFGAIEAAALREKKLKPEGEKHRRPYITAIIVYESVVGAHAAVSDFPALALREPARYGIFETVGWAAGREPDCVPKSRVSHVVEKEEKMGRNGDARPRFDPDPVPPLASNGNGVQADKKAPSFGSFKGARSSGGSAGGPSLDEVTMMRLKNAERRRMEEKIRREEEEAAAAAAAAADLAEST